MTHKLVGLFSLLSLLLLLVCSLIGLKDHFIEIPAWRAAGISAAQKVNVQCMAKLTEVDNLCASEMNKVNDHFGLIVADYAKRHTELSEIIRQLQMAIMLKNETIVNLEGANKLSAQQSKDIKKLKGAIKELLLIVEAQGIIMNELDQENYNLKYKHF